MRILLTLLMSTLTLMFQPQVYANSNTTSYFSNEPVLTTSKPGMISAFTCKVQEDRVMLNWLVSENETADRLIIQRSRNGKKFEMVGLVFASDKTEVENYLFNEKLTSRKSAYRIIIIRKDQSVEYSDIIRLHSEKGK